MCDLTQVLKPEIELAVVSTVHKLARGINYRGASASFVGNQDGLHII